MSSSARPISCLPYLRKQWAHARLVLVRPRRWQAKDHDEVNWHPDWIGVGNELVELHGLRAGATYALRVAAVSTQGRSWSEAAIFTTLTSVRCAEARRWVPLLDEADMHRVCALEHLALSSSTADPDARGACSVGWTEYILAGLAAGSTIIIILLSVVLDRPWARKLYFPEAPPRPPAQFFGIGGSAHFDIADGADGGGPSEPPGAAEVLLHPKAHLSSEPAGWAPVEPPGAAEAVPSHARPAAPGGAEPSRLPARPSLSAAHVSGGRELGGHARPGHAYGEHPLEPAPSPPIASHGLAHTHASPHATSPNQAQPGQPGQET